LPDQRQQLFEQSQLKNPPQPSEIEVTLFGKGIGESTLVHFGNGRYAVIDSFINPDSKNPVVLDYLSAIGASYDKIDMVVATHWHSDHIDGLAKVLSSASPSVKFVTYPIITKEKFIQYIEAGKKVDVKNMSTTQEFSAIYEMIETRKIKLAFSSHNKLLFNVDKNNISHNYDVKFYALSPQDLELANYLLHLNIPSKKTIAYSFPDDNDISIVVWLDVGGNIILLGGDLEEKTTDASGWKAVIKEHTLTGKADLFKVPHHGSISSHNADIWDKLLQDKPISILSVFSRRGLPQTSDKDRIKALSSQTLIAGSASKKTKDLDKYIKKFDIKLRALPSTIGIIRARKNLCIENANWNIEHFGEVEKIE
jgi:beta-lactamase superfamily II metal-dependent hydrolase